MPFTCQADRVLQPLPFEIDSAVGYYAVRMDMSPTVKP